MSKKQRDILYSEVQRHQQSQAGLGVRDDKSDMGDLNCAYRRSSSTTLSDLDDITALPEGLLFELPLTPEEAAGDYYNLNMLSMSGGSSSSSQSSPEQTNIDFGEGNDNIKQEYQLLHDPGLFSHAMLNPLPGGYSLLEIG